MGDFIFEPWWMAIGPFLIGIMAAVLFLGSVEKECTQTKEAARLVPGDSWKSDELICLPQYSTTQSDKEDGAK